MTAGMLAQAMAGKDEVRACNCIGPQGGERLCPCALRAKHEQESAMLRDGVEIAGKRYRLVPDGGGAI